MKKQSVDKKKKDKKKRNSKMDKVTKDKLKKKKSNASQSPHVQFSPPQLSSPKMKDDSDKPPPIEYDSDKSAGNPKKISDKEQNMKKKKSARIDVTQPKDQSDEKEFRGGGGGGGGGAVKKVPSTNMKKKSSRLDAPKDQLDEKNSNQMNDEELVNKALANNLRKTLSPVNGKKRSSRLDAPKDTSDERNKGNGEDRKVSTMSNVKKLSPANTKRVSARAEIPKEASDDDYFAQVKKVPSSANKKVASGRLDVKKTPSKSAMTAIPKKISKTGLSPESTGNSDQHEVRMTPSVVRRDLYNVLDDADGISDIKKLDITPQQSLQRTQSDIGPPKSVSGSNPLQPIRSQLQMPNTSGIVKGPGGITVHPLSLVRIDGDLIGRTGMYIERSGMSAQKKRAFDWLGLNRHQYQQKAAETVKNLEVALSDVGISKELFNQTLAILLADHQITQNEMDGVKQKLSSEYRGDFLTLSSAAWLLKENCRTYRRLEDEE